MKRLYCYITILSILMSGMGFCAAQEASKPLLTFYEPIADAKSKGAMTFDPQKPLLTISKVGDQRLAGDSKGVLLHFTPQDTKTFATLTTKFSGQFIIVSGSDGTMEALHITAPIEDGYLGFRYPEEQQMAAYLKSRLFPNQN